MSLRKPLHWVPVVAGTLALLGASGCAPREWLLPKVGIDAPGLWDYPADFQPPVSNETGQPMPGFGGSGAPNRTPLILIHGNTVSAGFWLPARKHLLAEGYQPSEIWAMSYGWNNVRYFDSNDLSVNSVDRIVDSVMQYLSQQSGREVRQVDIVGHSLGVTLVRQWMKQTNSWHKVRNFIGNSGANHGTWASRPDSRGQNRVVTFELNPQSPWIAQLNRGGETPGPTRYMTLYDGTGWADVFFAPDQKDSPRLEGATNLAYNREHGTHLDHLELPRVPRTLDAMVEWLGKSNEPLPEATPPAMVREGNLVRTEDADLYCAEGGDYPTRSVQPTRELTLAEAMLYTCYAYSQRSQLSSPMQRFKRRDRADPGTLTLTATPAGGVFENPQFVTLGSNDPDAYIVYSTAGVPVDSGSPLYQQPVYLPGPTTLTAMAISPDGRRSEMLTLAYDVSLEKIEAAHTLQRQFDPGVAEHYAGRRKKGR